MNSRTLHSLKCSAPLTAALTMACWLASGPWCGASSKATTKATITLTGWATWYDRKSCLAESGQAVMANGRPLRDDVPTCALWLTNSRGRPRRPTGATVRISAVAAYSGSMSVLGSAATGSVGCAWTDNGPGAVPRSEGVVVDLSSNAMVRLAGQAGIRAGRVRVIAEVE